MFKVNNKNTRTTVFLVFLLSILNIFHTFSSVSIVDLEQVNVGWDMKKLTENVLASYISNTNPKIKFELIKYEV